MNPKDHCEKLAEMLQWENDGHGWRTIDNEDDIWASWWKDKIFGQEFKFHATESTGVFEIIMIVRDTVGRDILITSGVVK